MSLGEFQLIARYLQAIGKLSDQKDRAQHSTNLIPNLQLGIGDDAAVLANLANYRLAISTDTLVESVHFPLQANPELLARRALRVNLSDMAAMGAEPKWFTLNLTLPEADEAWVKAFSHGLHQDAEAFGCQLIGGDTTRGPLNIGIQMLGLVPEGQKLLSRSGANAGDLLVVTGTLGDAAAALKLDLNSFVVGKNAFEGSSQQHALLARYWLPCPRVGFAQQAASLINAACDISDGLLADAGHLCEQSRLAATVDVEQVPLSEAYQRLDQNHQTDSFSMGDDYELCLAVPEENLSALEDIAWAQQTRITVVGRFHDSDNGDYSVRVRHTDRQPSQRAKKGYTHF